MNRRVEDYVAAARQFERLGRFETRPEALLMLEQAESCYRLALKRERENRLMQALGTFPPH